MLLNDIGKTPTSTLKKINEHLQANYGFKISESVQDQDLVAIMEQIQDEISELKIKGEDAKASPEISKRLLVLEGIRTLREFAMAGFQSPLLDKVVQNLVDYVVDTFHISGMSMHDFEEALHAAMKEYRSSRYRFPDDLIEQRVRQTAMSQLQGSTGTQSAPMMEDEEETAEDQEDLEEDKWIHTNPAKRGMFKGKDAEDIDSEKSALKRHDEKNSGHVSAADKTKMHELEFAARAKSGSLEEDDVWGSEGKRSGALGGHAPTSFNTRQQQLLGLDKDDEEPTPMVRDKTTGRMVPDPFAAHAAQRKQGIQMKESQNLVRRLRNLLETEVSQAEVMMAAKGFAQELQEMVEKIGRLQNEDLPPVTDQMRETYGMESASAFQTQIYGALQSVMDALYTAKQQVDDAVGNMAATGQVTAAVDMDKEVGGMEDPAMAGDEMDAELDLDNIGSELDAEDEFGGAAGEEPLGRSMKSEATLQKKILEMKKLVAKARRLQEAQR